MPLSHITEVGLISAESVNAAERNGVDLLFDSKIEKIILPDSYNPEVHGKFDLFSSGRCIFLIVIIIVAL